MNIAEANLLMGSLDDLSRTLMANKLEKRRAGETQQRIGLAGQEMDLRREDQTLDRQLRERELAAREAGARTMEQYRQDMLNAKTDEDKFRVFNDLVKSGAVTPQSLDAMSKAMSEKLGVQVTLQLPVKDRFETREGHDLALAEKYRDRAVAARRNGAGDEADRFLAIAERLERGGQAAPEDTAELTQEVGQIDPLTGKGTASLRRRIRGADIDEALRAGGVRAGPGAQPGADGTGDRVSVISPDGKRGSVPRSQLDAALKQGYKVAQ